LRARPPLNKWRRVGYCFSSPFSLTARKHERFVTFKIKTIRTSPSPPTGVRVRVILSEENKTNRYNRILSQRTAENALRDRRVFNNIIESPTRVHGVVESLRVRLSLSLLSYYTLRPEIRVDVLHCRTGIVFCCINAAPGIALRPTDASGSGTRPSS
jgi:hypothetical protein